jgi:hypothetical protein
MHACSKRKIWGKAKRRRLACQSSSKQNHWWLDRWMQLLTTPAGIRAVGEFLLRASCSVALLILVCWTCVVFRSVGSLGKASLTYLILLVLRHTTWKDK